MVKTKYFNLTNYAVGSGNVLIRKQIEDRQVNDKYLALVNKLMEFQDKASYFSMTMKIQ